MDSRLPDTRDGEGRGDRWCGEGAALTGAELKVFIWRPCVSDTVRCTRFALVDERGTDDRLAFLLTDDFLFAGNEARAVTFVLVLIFGGLSDFLLFLTFLDAFFFPSDLSLDGTFLLVRLPLSFGSVDQQHVGMRSSGRMKQILFTYSSCHSSWRLNCDIESVTRYALQIRERRTIEVIYILRTLCDCWLT